MLAIAALLLALASTALAQSNPRCDTFPAFNAHLVGFDPNRRAFHNHSSEFFLRARYVYDRELQAIRQTEEVEADEERGFFDELYLFKTRKMYSTDLRTKECRVHDIPSNFPFPEHVVPEEAEYFGPLTIGVERDEVLVNSFHLRDEREEGYDIFHVTRPAPGTDFCGFVSHDHFSNATGYTTFRFFNVTMGASPSEFTPPSECS